MSGDKKIFLVSYLSLQKSITLKSRLVPQIAAAVPFQPKDMNPKYVHTKYEDRFMRYWLIYLLQSSLPPSQPGGHYNCNYSLHQSTTLASTTIIKTIINLHLVLSSQAFTSGCTTRKMERRLKSLTAIASKPTSYKVASMLTIIHLRSFSNSTHQLDLFYRIFLKCHLVVVVGQSAQQATVLPDGVAPVNNCRIDFFFTFTSFFICVSSIILSSCIVSSSSSSSVQQSNYTRFFFTKILCLKLQLGFCKRKEVLVS